MILRHSKLRLCLSYLAVGLFLGHVSAQESSGSKVLLEEQPEEDFLIFLGNMSVVDGELSDPLDMLEMTDEKLAVELTPDIAEGQKENKQ